MQLSSSKKYLVLKTKKRNCLYLIYKFRYILNFEGKYDVINQINQMANNPDCLLHYLII